MQHSFAATNPCHVYDLALALHELDGLGCYYSGYPRWRLKPPPGFPMKSRSWRTLITYALQRFPERLRPDDARMFRWQDAGFDRAVSVILEGNGYLHGLPGQCMETFRAAKRAGMTTVLNHAQGPMRQWRILVAPEYERVGRNLERELPLPPEFEQRLSEEWKLADFHCVASTVVRGQLIAEGVPLEKIWVVPYGANQQLFRKRETTPSGPFRIAFAGRQSLRKGIHYLLKALEAVDSTGWELHCFGMQFAETQGDFENYTGAAKVIQRGSLSQAGFADALKEMHVLVLPSAEEAFGLVIVQALETGVPCIVSDRVGSKDLVGDKETGSIFPFGNIHLLAEDLLHWSNNRITVKDQFPWSACAEKLIQCGDKRVSEK